MTTLVACVCVTKEGRCQSVCVYVCMRSVCVYVCMRMYVRTCACVRDAKEVVSACM